MKNRGMMGMGSASLYHFKMREDAETVAIETALLYESRKAFYVDTGETDETGNAIRKKVPKSIATYDKKEGMLLVEKWFATKEELT